MGGGATSASFLRITTTTTAPRRGHHLVRGAGDLRWRRGRTHGSGRGALVDSHPTEDRSQTDARQKATRDSHRYIERDSPTLSTCTRLSSGDSTPFGTWLTNPTAFNTSSCSVLSFGTIKRVSPVVANSKSFRMTAIMTPIPAWSATGRSVLLLGVVYWDGVGNRR